MVHQLLLGGDQLTRKRMETAKECRKNGTTPTTQLTVYVKIGIARKYSYTCTTYIQWDKTYLLLYTFWISKCPLR